MNALSTYLWAFRTWLAHGVLILTEPISLLVVFLLGEEDPIPWWRFLLVGPFAFLLMAVIGLVALLDDRVLRREP